MTSPNADYVGHPDEELERPTGSEESPVYRKVPHDDGWATQLWFIVCHEGWRESIVCERMYWWAADWLIDVLQGKPFAPGRDALAESYAPCPNGSSGDSVTDDPHEVVEDPVPAAYERARPRGGFCIKPGCRYRWDGIGSFDFAKARHEKLNETERT